jgi:hypothetical protein
MAHVGCCTDADQGEQLAACEQAGDYTTEQVEFHTKLQLARRMLERALDAKLPATEVTVDESRQR